MRSFQRQAQRPSALDQGSDLVLWATGAEVHDWQRDPARRGALAVVLQATSENQRGSARRWPTSA